MASERTGCRHPILKPVAAIALAVLTPILTAQAVAIAEPGGRGDQSAVLDLARELRVASIGYRLARAAAGQCDRPEPMTGMVVHDIASYAEEDRPAIRNAFGLTGGFGVRLIVPGSAAARAGIRAGDEILSVNGQDMTAFAPELIHRSASPKRTERFVAMIRDSVATAPATLVVRRNGDRVTALLGADFGCSGRFVVTPSNALNAWSDGTGVAITSKLVDFVRNDDELAYILAHEMSHNILHHAERTKGRSLVLASFGIGAKLIKSTEIEADTMAVKLMMNAHYDPIGGETLLPRLMRAIGPDLAITHPGAGRRIQILRAARYALELPNGSRPPAP